MVHEARILGLLWPAKVTTCAKVTPFGVTMAGQGMTKITPADQVSYSKIIS